MSEPTRTIQMKLAKASAADETAVLNLIGILGDVFESSSFSWPPFPRLPDGNFSESDPDHFDEDNPHHIRVLYDRLKAVIDPAPGAMNRVVFGYTTLANPANAIIDPDLDYLAPHPSIVRLEPGDSFQMAAAAKDLFDALKLFMDQYDGDSPDRANRPEIIAARAAIAKATNHQPS